MILKHIQHLVNNLNYKNHCSVFQIHICIYSSKIRINVRVLHVYEWYVMCCVFLFRQLGLAAFRDTTNTTINGTLNSQTWVSCWHAWRAKYHLWTDGLPWTEQAEETERNEKDRHKSRVRRKTWMVIPHNNCTWKRRYAALYFMGWGVQKCVVYLF